MASNKTSTSAKPRYLYGHQDFVLLFARKVHSDEDKSQTDAVADEISVRKRRQQEEKDREFAHQLQQIEDREQLETLYAMQTEAPESELFMEEEEDEEEDDDDVQWISSHLNPERIIWSSNPKLVPPSIGYQPKKDDVIHTFFVQSPVHSTKDDRWENEILEAAKIIRQSPAVLIIAGAGMGVDSGLPDYRGPQGFWKAYPPLAKTGLSLEDISHPKWFEEDAEAAWGFYAHRANLYRKAVPHQGFEILKEIVQMKKDNYFVFTSNIDSQFQRAGFDEKKIYECHGSLAYLQCTEEAASEQCEDFVWPLDWNQLPKVNEENLRAESEVPRCICGSTARPNVSMFGDTNFSWKESRSHKQRDRLLQWLEQVRLDTSPVRLAIIEIGCGTSLHSISIESETLIAEDRKGTTKLIRINPTNSRVPRGGNIAIPLGGLAALQGIKAALQKLEENPELMNQTLKKRMEPEAKVSKPRLPGACPRHKRLHLKCPLDCPDRTVLPPLAPPSNSDSSDSSVPPIKKQKTTETTSTTEQNTTSLSPTIL